MSRTDRASWRDSARATALRTGSVRRAPKRAGGDRAGVEVGGDNRRKALGPGQALDDRVRGGPGDGLVRPALGGGRGEGAHAHGVERDRQMLDRPGLAADGPPAGDQELIGRLQLARRGVPGLWRGDQGLGHLAQVAAGAQPGRFQPRHQGGRRLVGDEVAGDLGADVPGRRRMGGQVPEDRQALIRSRRGVGLAHHGAAARFMGGHAEDVFALLPEHLPRTADAPAGQGPGELGDVFLAVAGVNADGVQFEDLPGEVLVQPAADTGQGAALEIGRRRALRADRLGLVEIEQHGRMGAGGDQQVLEAAEHPGADGFLLERPDHGGGDQLDAGDGEVIGPEQGPALAEARRGGRRQTGAGEEVDRGPLAQHAGGDGHRILARAGRGGGRATVGAIDPEGLDPGGGGLGGLLRLVGAGSADLGAQPALRIGRGRGDLTGPGAEPEPGHGDGGVEVVR
jgi:hypothetical protein